MTSTPLSDLKDAVFDTVVIGGGINGASAALQAAAAGYSTLLVEKNDFGSGATGRSSRLLHCGLRYLEAPNGIVSFLRHPSSLRVALRMARQGMQARRDMVLTSKARTRAMTLLFPIYRQGPYPAWQVDLAFKILGRMAPDDVPLNYRRMRKEEAMRNPLVQALSNLDDLDSVACFTEYQMDWPERLCIDAVLDARRMGATALNYTEASLGEMADGYRNIRLSETDDPANTVAVKARSTLLMAGNWIDETLRKTNPNLPRKTFGTKGASIVVKLGDACRDFGIATVNSKGEPFYCLPWHDRHYIGPTETPYDGNLDDVHADTDDIDFIIQETGNLFPGLGIKPGDIKATWAGVRPLTYDPAYPKGKRSREIHDLSAFGLEKTFAMTAGPVMTYRSGGKELVNFLKATLPPSGRESKPDFAPPPLPDNTNSPPLTQKDPAIRLDHLRSFVTHEQARNLTDLLYRRSGLALRHELGEDEIASAADILSSELGWNPAQRDAEILRYRQETERLFGIP